MRYISIDEFLMGRITFDKLTPEQVANANTIIPRVNELLEKFGQYRGCNSGYRSPEDQMRINPKAPKSKHMVCAAIDIEDKDGKLKEFIKNNMQLLTSIGLWIEDFSATPTWVHAQCIPPTSGKHIFLP